MLSPRQLVCLIGYITSLLSTMWAEIITLVDDELIVDRRRSDTGFNEDDSETVFSYTVLPQVLWLLAVIIFVSCGLLIFNLEGYTYAASRGYTEPLAVSRTSEGWEPVEEGYMFSILLGSIRVHASSSSAPPGARARSPLHMPLINEEPTPYISSDVIYERQLRQQQSYGRHHLTKPVASHASQDLELPRASSGRRMSGELEGGSDDF